MILKWFTFFNKDVITMPDPFLSGHAINVPASKPNLIALLLIASIAP
jgi:hypothetical protein